MQSQTWLPLEQPPTRERQMRRAFEEFDRQYPEVWKLFCRFCWEVIRHDYRHFSADAIMHRVRWETSVAIDTPFRQITNELGDGPRRRIDLKINNNHVAFYARKWAEEVPEHADLFATRLQVSSAKPPRRIG